MTENAVSEALDHWQRAGNYYPSQPSGHQIYYQDIGDAMASAETTLLLLHGFPESSFSYHKIIAGMQQHFSRIVVFDMPGYGFSDKPTEKYAYSLIEQADIAMQLWQHLQVTGGHVIAHDMGTSVLTELIAREVQGLLPSHWHNGFQSYTFTNGSMVLALAQLRITQKLLLSGLGPTATRFFNYNMFNHQVRSAHGNDDLATSDIEALWQQIQLQDGDHKHHLTIRYLKDRQRYETTRWLPALAATSIPIHLCWGTADAVARVAMPKYLQAHVCPNAQVSLMKAVGHFCQLSNPDIWVSHILSFYTDNL